MKIEHITLDDFCMELEREKSHVLEHVVRFQKVMAPMQQRSEPISFEVGVCATAVVKSVHGDWLVEYVDVVGEDHHDAEEYDGSEAADAMRQVLHDRCEKIGLQLLPGKIELY